ncbi:MAG: DoxX-like family protein [Aquabacterium sp.]|nr:DoxX-like family protein [Aquabacterium sp.]
MALTSDERRLAQASLVAVWVGTALASVLQADGLTRSLLSTGGKVPESLYGLIIWGISAINLTLGLWMAIKPGRTIYLCAMGMTLSMTAIATWIDPALWLHPMGPLSKDLPIMALLWILAKD